jgi:hypothetical protein
VGIWGQFFFCYFPQSFIIYCLQNEALTESCYESAHEAVFTLSPSAAFSISVFSYSLVSRFLCREALNNRIKEEISAIANDNRQ